FFEGGLAYRLPMRNVSWRLIRKIRTGKELATYEGFDRTKRSLFNHLAQGGTADIAKTMMLRAQPVCQRFRAKLIGPSGFSVGRALFRGFLGPLQQRQVLPSLPPAVGRREERATDGRLRRRQNV